MSWIICLIVEAILTTTFIFNCLDISISKQYKKFIINVIGITIIKAFIFSFWSEAGPYYKTLLCISIELIVCYALLRRNIWYIFCGVSMEYVVLELCKLVIFLMLGTSSEEMYRFDNAIKICAYLQYLIILLIAVNYKQQEIISNKDFYIKNADNALFMLRRQKHNFDNILNTISGLIHLEQYNKLGEFVKGAQPETSELQKCKNICLAALIAQKINCYNNKVKVFVKIRTGLENLNISDNELCECVGILLDNAFEASSLTNEPYIGIEIFEVMDITVIKIRNNCREIIDKKMLFKKGYTTKGKGRGLGLSIVKAIMNKYGNDLDVLIVKNEVRFSLIIHPESKTIQMGNIIKNSIPAACYSRIHEKV